MVLMTLIPLHANKDKCESIMVNSNNNGLRNKTHCSLQNLVCSTLIPTFIIRGKLKDNLISSLRQLTLMDRFVSHQHRHQTLHISGIF